jgi:hypothetical protein
MWQAGVPMFGSSVTWSDSEESYESGFGADWSVRLRHDGGLLDNQ